MDTKKGKRSTSHRYNQIPLLRSRPGGFKGSWPCRTYPSAKVLLFSKPTKYSATFFQTTAPHLTNLKPLTNAYPPIPPPYPSSL